MKPEAYDNNVLIKQSVLEVSVFSASNMCSFTAL